jgi:Lon protease-like protein
MNAMPNPLPLQSLPLFPLGTVLYPDGVLPLRIFEVRYLDMIGKCHKNGTPFGVVALTEGAEVRQVNTNASAAAAAGSPPSGDAFAHEAFNDVGTLATITALARPQAGLIMVQCRGTQRIRITKREKLKHGLWIADADPLAPDTAVDIPPDLQVTADGLGRIVQQLQTQGMDDAQMPFSKPYRLDDCGWVANRWCELLQLPLELKQRLMALDNPLVRLELVRDILDKARIAL